MENFAPLLLFALIGLIQLVVRWVRRMQQQQQRQSPPSPMPYVEPDSPPPFPPAEIPRVAHARMPVRASRVLVENRVPDDEELFVRMPARSAPTALPPRRAAWRPHPRVGTRADVRRAVVLMEILGPSRSAVDIDARGRR